MTDIALIILGILVLGVIGLRHYWRTQSVTKIVHDYSNGNADFSKAHTAAADLLKEIERKGREINAQIETKIRVLNELLLRVEGKPTTKLDEVLAQVKAGVPYDKIAAEYEIEQTEVQLIASLSSARGEAND